MLKAWIENIPAIDTALNDLLQGTVT